jgi:hypothetical protein
MKVLLYINLNNTPLKLYVGFKVFMAKNKDIKLSMKTKTTYYVLFQEKLQFFRRKLVKIVEYCYHNIGPQVVPASSQPHPLKLSLKTPAIKPVEPVKQVEPVRRNVEEVLLQPTVDVIQDR